MQAKVILLFIVLFLSGNAIAAQDSCSYCGEPIKPRIDTIFVYDTTQVYISNANDITEAFGLTYDEYVKQFLLFVQEKDSAKQFSSQEIYLNYFLPLLQDNPDYTDKRWLLSIFTIYASPDKDFMSYRPISFPDSLDKNACNLDILVECNGDKNTDYFLKSPHLTEKYLIKLFAYIHQENTITPHKIKGINFYFPEFSFKEKRAMAQFAKSVSLVTDSCRLKSIQDLRLYLSFDSKTGNKHREYLACIADMTDSIFLFDTSDKEHLFSPTTVITRENADEFPLIYKIRDQFYLASFFIAEFPKTSSTEFIPNDIIQLMHSDYPENNWETYCFALLAIIIFVMATAALYWIIPTFSYYLNKNKDYMITLVLMLIFEILLLLFAMFEAFSRSSIFEVTDKNKNIIFLMPLIIIFISPLIKMLKRNDKLP
jgi:hypothetical protein